MGLSPVLDVTIIAPRHKMETVLKELYAYGDFHISKADGFRDPVIHELEHRAELGSVNTQVLIQELAVKDQVGVMDQLFGRGLPSQETFTAQDVRTLLDKLDAELKPIRERAEGLLQERKNLEERRNELSAVRDTLQTLSGMNIDFSIIRGFKRFYVYPAVVTASEMAEIRRSMPDVVFLEASLPRSNVLMMAVVRREDGEQVERVLKSLGVKPLTISEDLPQIPSQAYKIVAERLEDINKRLGEIDEMLKEIREKVGARLVAMRDCYEILRQALYRLGYGGLKLFSVIRGYIPAGKSEDFKKSFEGKYPVYIGHTNTHDKHHESPSIMSNKGLLAAFEKITLIQGVPRSSELDPTPYVAIFFSIFFGIMFADMGHGLVILSFALFMLKRVKSDLRRWALILATLGITSLITGYLIGEAFGFKVGKAILSPELVHLVEEHGGTKTFNILEVQRLLVFTIFLGVVHLTTGYVLSIVKLVRERELAEALFVKLPTLAMYVFGIFFGLAFFGAGGDLAQITTSTSPAPITGLPTNLVGSIGVYGAIACIIILMIGRLVAGLTGLGHRVSVISSVGQGLLEVLENIIHFLSNTISYARLTILLIVHTALLILLNTAWGALGITALPLLIIGNIGIILLEGMLVFIQSMRLHIYEFFSKFYDGTGEQFKRIAAETPFAKIRLGE